MKLLFPFTVVILAVTGISGILSIIVNIPLIAVYLVVLLLCCGVGINVMNAMVVDIYPTNLRYVLYIPKKSL